MSWISEYEHLRDKGHTWGPGIDDVHEPTEEEWAEFEAEQKAFEQIYF